uniref:Myb/SANT-like DNA-binding domain-containing protein n=1 Tax=Magallana gigas TaxID=29159 RepID=A0A8W8I1Z4_MAGGI
MDGGSRKPNWSEAEISLLVEQVEQKKDVLKGKFSLSLSATDKTEVWSYITDREHLQEEACPWVKVVSWKGIPFDLDDVDLKHQYSRSQKVYLLNQQLVFAGFVAAYSYFKSLSPC